MYFSFGKKNTFALLKANQILTLTWILGYNQRLLLTSQDGDEVSDHEGNPVVWSPDIRTQVEAEIADVEARIAALS